MKKIIGVYFIKNKVTGKFYVGHSINILNRFVRHRRDLNLNIHHCAYLQRAWNKYGSKNFKFSICKVCNTEEESINLEQYYIDNFKDRLYNTSYSANYGGDMTSNHPNKEIIIAKRKDSLKITLSKMSKEERISKYAKNGCKNGMYGKKMTKEQREYLSKLYTGRKSEYKGMTYEERYGEDKAKEIKENLSKKAKSRVFGKNNPFYRKTHTEETKKIMSEKKKGNIPANRRKVLVGNNSYDSLAHCGKAFGISPATVLNRIKSKNYPEFKYAD